MPKTKWTTEQTLVLIYFNSCHVTYEECRHLILHKCNILRNLGSLRGKVISVRHEVLQKGLQPLWDVSKRCWIRENVDLWILNQRKNIQTFEKLIEFGATEQGIIKKKNLQRVKDVILESTVPQPAVNLLLGTGIESANNPQQVRLDVDCGNLYS